MILKLTLILDLDFLNDVDDDFLMVARVIDGL
jgi:hypothetical protein